MPAQCLNGKNYRSSNRSPPNIRSWFTRIGPGLLESAYEACLVFELQEKGLNIERQKPLPLVYKNVKLDSGYRLDLIVETKVVVEVKSMTEIAAVHKAQRYCCVNRFLTPRSPSFHEITKSQFIIR